MGKTIGIKLADGSFSPIIKSGAEGSKLLNLTTTRDDQTEVHIDLFSSDDTEMKEAEYVTTLQLDRLEPHPAGDLDVIFLISIDKNDELSAEISEPKSGNRIVKKIPQISQATAATVTPDFALVEAEEVETKAEDKPDDFTVVSDLPDFDFDLIEPDEPAEEDAIAEDDEEFSFLDETLTEETAGLPEDIDIDLSSLDLILSEDETNIAAADTSEKQEPAAGESLTLSEDDFAFLDDDTEIQSVAETTESVDFFSGLELPADDSPLAPVSEDEVVPTVEEIVEPDSDVPLGENTAIRNEFADTASSSLAELFDEVKTVNDDIESEIIGVQEKRGRFTAAVITGIICALLCVGALLIVCFFLPSKSLVTETIEVTSQVVETPAPPVETVRIIPEVIVPKVPVIEPEPEAVKLSEPVVPEPPAAVHYRLRWGDTLWDIAGTYYNNPWLYRSIAQYNGIQNPSHIVSGTDILIPPR
jgi:hypothetical protein